MSGSGTIELEGYKHVLRLSLLSLPSLPVCRVRGELKVQTANWMCPKGSGPPPARRRPHPPGRKEEGGRRRKAVEKTTDLSAAAAAAARSAAAAFYLGKDER